jgi:hypothetical protein
VSGQDIAIVTKQSQVEGDVFGFVGQLKNEAASNCRDLECLGMSLLFSMVSTRGLSVDVLSSAKPQSSDIVL